MKKEVNPAVIGAILAVLLVVIVIVFVRATTPPEPVEADPLGNPAKDKALQAMKDGTGPTVTPDVEMLMKRNAPGGPAQAPAR
ncbi:MAG: hypothetical protein OHK0029_41590 [Armatimonadaceae bacterium]